MTKYFKWNNGRQGGAYQNMLLFSCRFFDCYLIKFKSGFKLPIHVDEVTDKQHYRMNFLIYGEDAYEGNHIFRWRRIVIFRPDQPHGTKKLNRKRLLFSIGWTRNKPT